MGLDSKDIDFTFVLDNLDLTVEDGFQIMSDWLDHHMFTTFLRTPECFTIRAKFPQGHENEGMVADFVLARKEVGYEEGTRRPILELGTLEDDLIRRDFTVNAIAEDEQGSLIDPFGGGQDIIDGVLRTPMDPMVTLMEDPLRILRAFRFSLTKNFLMDDKLQAAISQREAWDKMKLVVSQDRIRDELTKCFHHDTVTTLGMLFVIEEEVPGVVADVLFANGMWLQPTNKK
jgi:tRNA nucleotidyltransferase/poly(A) polymerase